MSYALIDIVLMLLLLIITIRAALHGFVEEVFGVAWLILGLIFAVKFYVKGAAFIRTKILQDVKILPEVLAFIALFLIVFVIVKAVTFMLKDIIEKIRLGGLDHFLGALFGILEGLAAAALVIFIINVQPLFDKDAVLKGSIFNQVLSGSIKSVQETVTKQEGAPPLIPADIGNTEKN
ncbi:MAG: CvpA family protein [Spirochaetaceae bacterium]|jgi:membrane protein required for colicin V production|nr:CvpA family protein [Spirochaetaceae bacterium]